MNAGPIARHYRWIEYAAFGRTLERCRREQVTEVADSKRVLILGEGDGRFLRDFLDVNKQAHVDVVDMSLQMLDLAKSRLSPSDLKRVTFFHENAVQSAATAEWHEYDLVVTNFFLDCLSCSEVALLVQRVASSLLSGGHWIVGEFQRPVGKMAGVHAFLWIKAMYFFFRITTGLTVNWVPEYGPILNAHGLKLVKQRVQRFGMISSQLWRKSPDNSLAHRVLAQPFSD